jgi:hypothetical protein
MPESADIPPLSWVHAGRLRAAERGLASLLSQIEAIGREGRNPSGQGAPYLPLAAEEWTLLAEPLGALAETARRLGALAGDTAGAAPPGRAATRAALSARLAQLEETLADLRPARLQARYGALPPDTAAELEALCGRMEAQLAEARRVLDTGKSGK